ncbi:roadblock/LC7 domain-containing protein [Vandammella animalimorsus]|nr:roadblock/LC7 domain-containing protein [Vandammella animalimorsus]
MALAVCAYFVFLTMLSPVMQSQARSILRELRAGSAQIELTAWVSFDGFVLAAATEANVNADRIGAMCASLLALSRRATKEIDVGDLKQIILGGSSGIMLLIEAGTGRALTLSAESSANLGRILLDARKAAMRLAELGG